MSRNREDPDTVGHHNILSLPGNPKACLLQSADGVLMVDARNPLHGLRAEDWGALHLCRTSWRKHASSTPLIGLP